MAKIYKQVKDSVICDVSESQEVRFYIPENYFTSKLSVVIGEYVRTLGLFNYAVFDSKTEKPVGKLRVFNFPSIFLCQPRSIVKAKDVKLTKNSDKQDYRILTFKKGDKLVVNIDIPEDAQNMEDLIKLFAISGRIPNGIDYRNLWKYPIDNAIINGNKYSISYQFFGILMSELCRDPNDLSKPFRLSSAKKNKDWTGYKSISIKEIPKYTSPYVSLTSENFDDSVVAATMMKDAKYSPLERVLTGKKPTKEK